MKQLSNILAFGGQQIQFTHQSGLLKCDMQCSIYLPPMAEQQRVPVLYWLSGLTCNDQNFVTKAGAQRVASELGVAIVCPDTSPRGDDVPDDPDGAWDFGLGASFYVNARQKPWIQNYQMSDYIVNELPKLIESSFNVDKEMRSISGHSMGGHGALTIGIRHLGRYQSVSAFSPIVSPINCPWGKKALGGYLGADQSEWLKYDACALIGGLEAPLPILVDQGVEDSFLQLQLKTHLFEEAAANAGRQVEVRYQDGYDHSYYFVASFIEDHIRFHARYLQGETAVE